MIGNWFRLVLSFILFAICAMASPSMELVQSVPLETNLVVPGVRQTQEVWLDMIRGAKSTLDLEQFYVSEERGQALTPVLAAIQNVAKQGVHVRLLVDSQFFKTYPDFVNVLGSQANCEARTIDFSKNGGIQHAKYFVVDGSNSFVGSQNFDWRALSHIHEIGVRVDDSAVGSQLEKIFEKDWANGIAVGSQEARPSPVVPPVTDKTSVQNVTVVAAPQAINPSGIGYSLKAIEDLINAAKRTVRVQVMEYTTKPSKGSGTWKDLDTTLRNAAKRGVQVELIVDIDHAKKAQAILKSLLQVKNIQVKAVTIPAWSGGQIPYARLIHSKYLLVDGTEAWIGSENWSQGYFLNTRDVGVVTSDSDIVGKLGQVFDTVWQSEYAASL